MAAEVQISHSETESLPLEQNSLGGFDEHKLQKVIAEGSLDFYEWTSLISDIENLFPDDIHKICLLYDAFLAEFPLCYGYWRKYAEHKTRLCTIDKVFEVFERAVQSATYSVGVWFDYCSFSMSALEDPHDIRRLFGRGISVVGKDYLCHALWDKYLEFEFSLQQWSFLADMYIQALRFPSKKLHRYYDSFKKLAAAWKEELECQSDSAIEIQSGFVLESEDPTYYKDDEISSVINDLLDPSDSLARSKALHKYILIGEQIYKEASQLDEKIQCFETHIRRPYFHVKPLDDRQLENWHDYLNFAEKQGDFDWVVKLYERCLIPCANYPEFWMRYVDFMESKGGREIANLALTRATQIFLKRLPVIHLFSARYKEHIGDVYAARAALVLCDTESDSSFVEYVTIKANMEKRLGNFVAACNVYKEALETATEKKKLHILPTLYVHFSQLKYMTTNNADAALDILVDGIKHVPGSKLLVEELIKFAMMHGGTRHMNLLDSVITTALYSGPGALRGFSVEDVEDISSLYLQFVDLCGTIDDVRKAWNWRMKLFPHSMRTSCEPLSWTTNPLETVIEGKKETIVALPPHPSGSDHLEQSASEDNQPSPPESHDTQSDQAATALVSDQKSLFPENHDIRSNTATVNLQFGEADNNAQERLQPVPPEASEQQREDTSQPNLSSVDFVHQIPNETEAVQASQEFFKDDDHEFNQDLKPLSLEGLSLDPRGNESPGSLCATSHRSEVPLEPNLSHESMPKSEAQQETSTSNGNVLQNGQNSIGSHFVSSPMGIQPSDSSHIQTGMVSPSSSASHQNFATEALSRPQTPASSGRNWHQKNHTNRNRRDSKFGFRGPSHKRLHQQQQVSSQQYPWTEAGGQMPMDPGYSSQSLPLQNQIQQGSQQNQYPASAILATPQAWPMQNIQPQNFNSQSQLPAQPVAYPQAQMPQYPTPSNGQHGNVQNNQVHNQMWQYYYYQQQQQFLLPQQQQLQQQQPHDQQLLQQQYQQQQLQLQQQYFQHQQMQQLPHMQQHPQLQQQQPYQQQQQQQYIQQQQPYNPHMQQHLQQLQHQQQLQQQPPLQIQVEQEQRQAEQQITISQVETWNISCPKQDQEVTLQHSTGTPEAVTSAASPCPQQQSPLSQ
ncbi:hypothetical protein QYF36_020477 [Acer negundo]|nr:hypothetical protein QYF36_020477 [Acer negundo]